MATLPIAYILHVKRSKTLRISTACSELIGKKADGITGQAIDIFIFGLVGGVGTSLGVGIPMLSPSPASCLALKEGFY